MLENRPIFHFTTQKNWINDPNGLVFLNGEYHLFFQHNPLGDTPGNIGWGHAVSTDLITWTELPMALPFANGIMAFSGSVVVDKTNSSGFGQNALIALFTAHHTTKRLEAQHLAFSTDLGRTWGLFEGNPVLDLGKADFRDPKVFWHEPTQRWVMLVVLPDEHKVLFYNSSDLKNWVFLSDFGPAGASNGIWEVPDMFCLPLEGRQHWVLKVDIGSGGQHGGSAGQYFTGQFNGTTFIADSLETKWLDDGKDFYAALSFANLESRTVWLAWMNNWEYAALTPTSPWRGAMSIPRELSLKRTAQGIRLVQQPIPELGKLRTDCFQAQNFQINNEARALPLSGTCLEIQAEFSLETASEFGFQIGADIQIGYDSSKEEIFIDRKNTGQTHFHANFSGRHHAKLLLPQGTLHLQIFQDHCSLEVFVQHGEIVLTDLIFLSEPPSLKLYAKNGSVLLKNLAVWELKNDH
jgi:fructan beta-fructosidase